MAKSIKGTGPNAPKLKGANVPRKEKDSKEKRPEELQLSQLQNNTDTALTEYGKIHKRLILLNAIDNGKFWSALKAKFPKYQILPDTNWVSYIKSNILASVYTVGKSASLIATSDEDKENIMNINVALDYIWDITSIPYKQMQAGNNAALYNLGITQVGWDNNVKQSVSGGSKISKGNVVIKNINPVNYMRDPFAESLDTASYVITFEDYHKHTLLSDGRYKERFVKYLEKKNIEGAISTWVPKYKNNRADASTTQGYYRIFTHFTKYIDKEDDYTVKIAEIHTIENEFVLYENLDIKPRCFPFAELFCNLPDGDPVGTSEPAKILSNNIAYNMLSSIMMTSEYKNQRPPKFITSQSGLNIRSFTKYGNEADNTFVVNGDASRAVHYHQFPAPSAQAVNLQNTMVRDVQTISSVDGRYTGRDTGSVITTGGIENMLGRVTLIDAPRIANYEKYTTDLTKLVLHNFVEYGLKRKYFVKDPVSGASKGFEVDFKTLQDPSIYHYNINISSELPNTKQRLASTANMLMEKQMQYGATGQGVELITPQEWLAMQDLPNTEYMLKRMNMQSVQDAAAEVATTLFSFNNYVKAGVDPDSSVAMIAENMAAQRRGDTAPNDIPVVPMSQTAPLEAQVPQAPNLNLMQDPNIQALLSEQ